MDLFGQRQGIGVCTSGEDGGGCCCLVKAIWAWQRLGAVHGVSSPGLCVLGRAGGKLSGKAGTLDDRGVHSMHYSLKS